MGANEKNAIERAWPLSFAPGQKRIIVLARLEGREILVKRGRTDIGELNKFDTVYVPVTCIWLNEGTEEDVASAREYALKNNYRVLCYPLGETDPLGHAKTDIYGSLDWKAFDNIR